VSALAATPALFGPIEESLYRAFVAGDEKAFAAIVGEHQGAILAFCLRFLGDASLAKDAAQEVFLSLWRERRRYRERGKLRTYLFRIARNRCLALAKKRRSQLRLGEQYGAVHEEPLSDEACQRERAAAVYRALGALKPKQAELVLLRHVEGFGVDEIAEITGLPAGTVKSRLSRALKNMRLEMSNADD
jgi:RNA polymerase sigma-70 factor (ECF subfamily)